MRRAVSVSDAARLIEQDGMRQIEMRLPGAIGVGTGFGLAYVISTLIGFPLLVSITSAVLGVGVSSAVGIISGLWPAWRAARLDPIEALRAE